MQKEEQSKSDMQEQNVQALKLSIEEGSAAAVSSGVSNSFISNFALALKATSFEIGILSSLAGLLPQLIQPWGNSLVEKKSRKQIVMTFALFEALLWIPLALIGFLYWKGMIQQSAVYLAIVCYTLLNMLKGAYYPAWFSWMGDLVPVDQRGKYFSKRNLASGLVEIASTLIGIAIIDAFESNGYVLLGLGLLFILASIFRVVSYVIIKRQYEPSFQLKKEGGFTFWQFVRRYDNFGKFAVYQGFLYFAIMIASPFFTVYMIRELNFTVATSVAVTMSGSIFYLVFLPVIGRISDRYGNLTLLYLANLSFALSPVLWLISKNPWWLGTGPQIVIGLGNAALVIAITNFSYDAVTQNHRGLCISYTNILIGIGTFAGALIGGALLSFIGDIAITTLFVYVFILSAILRFLVGILFLPKIKEVRKTVEKMPLSLQLHHPFKTLQVEVRQLNQLSRSEYTEGLKIWRNSKRYVLQKKPK